MRKLFLSLIIALLSCDICFAREREKFVGRVKTESGSIVGNIVVEAFDLFAAASKINRRYPRCEILELKKR